MIGIALFCFFIGTLIGVSFIPIVYIARFMKNHKRNYGFRGKHITILKADSSILKSKQEEHSANDYK